VSEGLITGLLVAAILIGLGAGAFVVARSPTFWLGLSVTAARAALPLVLKALKPKDWTQEQLDRIAMGEDPWNISRLDHEKWLQRQAMKGKK
jgi:hypothetical protein